MTQAEPMKLQGNCLCCAVSFEVADSFDKLFLCCCDQCRQITGSAFASNLFVDIHKFDWLGGTDKIVRYQVPGRDISKSFCRLCGSGVPWISGDGAKMIVPAGVLSGPARVHERTKIFASELPEWAVGIEHVPTYAGFPENSEK